MQELFGDRLADAVHATGAPIAVGLDPHLDRLPERYRARFRGLSGPPGRAAAADAVVAFNGVVISAIRGLAPAVKPQFAFYEALGAAGFAALEQTCAAAREAGLLVVGDGKRGDISSTARAYATAALDPAGPLGCDALTINPWMGTDTLEPYLDLCREQGRGLFVLVRTTNPGSAELQLHGRPAAAWRLAERLASIGADLTGRSATSSIGAVVGASAAADAVSLRAVMPAAWFLVPGVGAQGGSAADGMAGARADGLGALISSSRGVIYGPASESDDATLAAGIRARTEALAREIRAVGVP